MSDSRPPAFEGYWDIFMVPAGRPDLKFAWARPPGSWPAAAVHVGHLCNAVESADPPPWFEELIQDKAGSEIRVGLSRGTAFVVRVLIQGELQAETAVIGDLLEGTSLPAWNRVRAAIWAAHSRVCRCGADL